MNELQTSFNGHYCIDKAPGLSFLGVPVYFVVSRMTQPKVVQNFIVSRGRAPVTALTINCSSDQVSIEELVFAGCIALTKWLTVGLSPVRLEGYIR